MPAVKKTAPKVALTKKAIAREIFKNLNEECRVKILKQFVDKVKLTPAGASTFYHSFVKEVREAKEAKAARRAAAGVV